MKILYTIFNRIPIFTECFIVIYIYIWNMGGIFYHLSSFPSGRETISRLGFKLPTTSFSLGTSLLSYGSWSFSFVFICSCI